MLSRRATPLHSTSARYRSIECSMTAPGIDTGPQVVLDPEGHGKRLISMQSVNSTSAAWTSAELDRGSDRGHRQLSGKCILRATACQWSLAGMIEEKRRKGRRVRIRH